MNRSLLKLTAFCFLALQLASCTTTGPGLFKKKSPHEQYRQMLENAGLQKTALGKKWIEEAEKSLSGPLEISIPYKETGYFSAEYAEAAGLSFQAKRGEKVIISLERKPVQNFRIYVDLWRRKENEKLKLLAFADTTDAAFSYEIDDEGDYLLRLQPELLVSGEYTLSISSGPSLAFPVRGKGINSIQSLYGADRDAGTRKHEGVDIFAARKTPAIAAAPGVITRSGENNLGGKVVFLRPENKNYTLYYAHLDTQLVQNGKTVRVGDTLGLIGNTGNARFTAPHLHFGIYTFLGAVDPLPFIDPREKKPKDISAPLSLLSKSSRTNSNVAVLRTSLSTAAGNKTDLPSHTIFRVDAATSNWFKITLPDGQRGFIRSSEAEPVERPVRKITIENQQALYERPDTLAARKMILPSGESVKVLGSYNRYYFVSNGFLNGWIKKF